MCVWWGGYNIHYVSAVVNQQCECVCVMGGGGGGGGGGGEGGIAFIMSLQLLINSVWKCRLI